MKKSLLSLTIISLTVFPLTVFGIYTEPIIGFTWASLFSAIENFFWWIVAATALVCFVIAGVLFLTAQGEPQKITIAKNAVIWGTVGIAVAIIAYVIVAIVSRILTA